jgi:hypothetical protein
MLELLYNNYFSLKEGELKIFKKFEFIFNEYMYNPRHEPIDMESLLNDLKQLGKLIYIAAYGKKITTSIQETNVMATGIKRRKTRRKNNSSIFKRKKLIKKFKNPFFLSLK